MTESARDLRGLLSEGQIAKILDLWSTTTRDVRAEIDEETSIVVASALVTTGDISSALRVLPAAETAPKAFRPEILVISGLVARRRGDRLGAEALFEQARKAALAINDRKQIAWAFLHGLRSRISSLNPETQAAQLEQAKRLSMDAGDPLLACVLHETAAISDGQLGRLRSGRRHIATARSILDAYPNAVASQGIAVAAGCLHMASSDIDGASHWFQTARRFHDTTRHESYREVVRANEMLITLLRGKLATSAKAMSDTFRMAPPSARHATADSLARLHLALGSTEAIPLARSVRQAQGGEGTSYHSRWAGLTICKALHRERRYEELFTTLTEEQENARQAGDHPLLASLLLVRAEACAERGQRAEASRHLFEAARLGISGSPELQGHFQMSAGRILGRHHAGLGSVLTQRALRRWRSQRNVLALVEAETFGKPPLPLADYDRDERFAPGSAPLAPHVPVEDRPFAVVESIAQLLSTADTPELLGEEVRQLAVQLGLDRQVSISSGKPRKKEQPSPADTVTVSLDAEGQRDVTLSCRPGTDPAANVALSALTTVVRSAVNLHRLKADEKDRSALWPISDLEVNGALFVDEQMVTLLGMARKVAAADVTVLITGETGTGKDVLARAIHSASGRAKHAMVPFNCSSCPREMVDAQLFGHRRGSFTGAVDTATGIIRGVSGGTLFLDEVGDAPLDIQPKLLRFLESNEVHPIGEARPSTVDVRVIAATNVDLQEAVRQGRFREDLFYRLNIVTLQVPPLRDRRSEIPVLAAHYLQQAAMAQRKGALRLAEETVEYLLLYRWPGNVRQLANEIRRLAALAERDQVLMPEHLSPDIAASRRTVPPSNRTLDPNEVAVRTDQPLSAAAEHLERAMILQAMEACNNKVEEAAKRLGLSRKGLYLKRVRFGLCTPETAEPGIDASTEEA